MRYYIVTGIEEGKQKDRGVSISGNAKFNKQKHFDQNPKITQLICTQPVSFEKFEEARKANMGV